jgi:hypothetical protein
MWEGSAKAEGQRISIELEMKGGVECFGAPFLE